MCHLVKQAGTLKCDRQADRQMNGEMNVWTDSQPAGNTKTMGLLVYDLNETATKHQVAYIYSKLPVSFT